MNRSRNGLFSCIFCCLFWVTVVSMAETPAVGTAPLDVPPEVKSGKYRLYIENTKAMVEKGEYQEALIRYQWFFDHVLEYDRNAGPVRHSYLVAAWVELGKKYPPALAELVRLRDEKTTYLRKGKDRRQIPVFDADGSDKQPVVRGEDWAAFQKSIAEDVPVFSDVASINFYLKEEEKTLVLFCLFNGWQPEFAKACIHEVEEMLIRDREFALVKKYLDIPYEWDIAKKGLEFCSDVNKEVVWWGFSAKAYRMSMLARETGEPELADRILAEYQALKDSREK